jgi:hypothetical protein
VLDSQLVARILAKVIPVDPSFAEMMMAKLS